MQMVFCLHNTARIAQRRACLPRRAPAGLHQPTTNRHTPRNATAGREPLRHTNRKHHLTATLSPSYAARLAQEQHLREVREAA
ncbi:hypothetical protein, partial [Cupriavidus sp. TA19]|uniref:hypothetical protein n=1 Tax=Cupriavidus sp. TA19 TaxID=701108 RepID=UPI00295E8D97